MARRRTYNVAEAKAKFSALVREALRGDEVVIARDNKPLVKLIPLVTLARKPGGARGQVRIAADFDRTPDDFADYV
jgi:prevent-host-death family protein